MGKIFARVIIVQVQQLPYICYHSVEFFLGRSTVNMICSVRQLQEKCTEKSMQLYISFIYRINTFDLISGDGLLKMFTEMGCHQKLKVIS